MRIYGGEGQDDTIGRCGDHGVSSAVSDGMGGVTSVDGAQREVPEETRSNDGSHGFWNRVNTVMFDVIILNLDVVSYLCMPS